MIKSLGLLTVSQAADYLNIPRPTLYQHLREGKIPGIQIGGRWRIEQQALHKLVERATPSTGRFDQNTSDGEQASVSNETFFSREAQQLKEENQRLRQIIADQTMEIHRLERAPWLPPNNRATFAERQQFRGEAPTQDHVSSANLA